MSCSTKLEAASPWAGAGTSDRRWLHQDQLGSAIAVSNGSGAALSINTYDEYGVPGSSNAGRFQYTGQMWIPEASLYHYKARAYAPSLGRFLQSDPILQAGGMNIYAYVGNDPVNRIDPWGLCENPLLDGGGAPCEEEEIVVLGKRPIRWPWPIVPPVTEIPPYPGEGGGESENEPEDPGVPPELGLPPEDGNKELFCEATQNWLWRAQDTLQGPSGFDNQAATLDIADNIRGRGRWWVGLGNFFGGFVLNQGSSTIQMGRQGLLDNIDAVNAARARVGC